MMALAIETIPVTWRSLVPAAFFTFVVLYVPDYPKADGSFQTEYLALAPLDLTLRWDAHVLVLEDTMRAIREYQIHTVPFLFLTREPISFWPKPPAAKRRRRRREGAAVAPLEDGVVPPPIDSDDGSDGPDDPDHGDGGCLEPPEVCEGMATFGNLRLPWQYQLSRSSAPAD